MVVSGKFAFMRKWVFAILFSAEFYGVACANQPILSDRVSLVDSKRLDFKRGDDRDRWATTLEICWKAGRARLCGPGNEEFSQKFALTCSEGHGANCLGKSCYLSNFKELKEETSTFAVIKGVHRDFLLFQGAGSGCGGSRYSAYVFDESGKLRCQLAEGFVNSGEPEDEKAEKLLETVNKNPLRFISWRSDGTCEFRFSKKEQAILKAKQ